MMPLSAWRLLRDCHDRVPESYRLFGSYQVLVARRTSMKKSLLGCGLALMLLAAGLPTRAGVIDADLQNIMATLGDDEEISVLVYVRGAVDIAALSRALDQMRASNAERHQIVVTTLQATAESTQPALREHLSRLQRAGRVKDFQPYWIANCIRVDATVAEIKELANHPDVDTIYFNYPIELIEPEFEGPVEPFETIDGPRGPTTGLQAIRAPEAWALGYDGTGILVATLDTGVDGSHPALASRWRGLDPRYQGHPEWAFFDPVTHWTFPQDSGSHGTHTMGTVCGGSPGQMIGVAPGAQWIHAAVIDRGQPAADGSGCDRGVPVADRSRRQPDDQLGCAAGVLELLGVSAPGITCRPTTRRAMTASGLIWMRARQPGS
jgi:subtilisin family serine protease